MSILCAHPGAAPCPRSTLLAARRLTKNLLFHSSSVPDQRRAISIRLSSSPTEVLSTDLGVGPDGFLALHAGVGAELLEALDAAVPPLLLHILLALQGVTAVVAVEALRHRAHGVAARPSCKSTVGERTALRPWKLQGSSFLGLCRSVGGRWLRNEHVMVLSHSSRAPW